MIGITPVVSNILIAMGSISMLLGAFMGFGQDDMKRMFAFSSISQMGYIAVGIGIGTPLAIIGALFHLLNHAGFKSLLFLSSGAIQTSTGTRNLSRLGGLREKMPVTSATSVIGSLSIAGVPPFNGFWSKFIIILAAFSAGYFWLGAILILTAFLTLAYYLRFQKNVIFGEPTPNLKGVREAPFLMLIPIVILAIFCLGAGIFNGWVVNNIIMSAQSIILDQVGYISSVLGI
jgi:multicomponent Na+:H+ antiporter subunit D